MLQRDILLSSPENVINCILVYTCNDLMYSHFSQELDELSVYTEEHSHSVTMGTFPQPSGREFILRATVPSQTHYSTPCPQRLFCILTRGEFRLAGAFGSDTKLT